LKHARLLSLELAVSGDEERSTSSPRQSFTAVLRFVTKLGVSQSARCSTRQPADVSPLSPPSAGSLPGFHPVPPGAAFGRSPSAWNQQPSLPPGSLREELRRRSVRVARPSPAPFRRPRF